MSATSVLAVLKTSMSKANKAAHESAAALIDAFSTLVSTITLNVIDGVVHYVNAYTG